MEADDLCQKRVGTVLRDKWTLERLLGVGGMAAVYVARHKIGRLDAIKILHPELARAEQVRKRFEQEAHVLNSFRHPGAVEVRDLETTDDGSPFIVMELLDGKSLADRIRDGRPSVDETLRVADEVLDVLAAAHARGIIHRDIKPDNLFVTAQGAVKVLDFGIAQVRSGAQNLKTKTGTTLGTVAYMPPEQLKGLDIDPRADLYGVGATMFRMLAGRPPHDAGSEVELMMKVLSDPAPRLESVVEGVRADVARVVNRALAFDREARFPNARAMQTEVRAARNEPHPEIAAPLPPQSNVATVTPARLSPATPEPVSPVFAPTMHAAPESALLREAVPSARAVSQPSLEPGVAPAPSPSQPVMVTRVSAASGSGPVPAAREDKREIAGIPLIWLLVAGGVMLVAIGALLSALAIAAFRGHTASPDDAGVPAFTATPTATPTPTPQQPPDDPEDEDRPPGPPGHHPPPPHGPHGHGKHRP